nr:hypothetical protein BaRGS_018620 [Batillaria attramentaria]
MCSTDWNPTRNEASIQVPIVAAKDHINDGNKDLLLRFETLLSSGGGPYQAAFDGTYNFYKVGDYTLYENPKRDLEVYLPSGTEVKIDANNWYMNTYITAPSIDKGEGRGLCGTFDGDPHNDFTHRDGTPDSDSNGVPVNFTESWKQDRQ